MAIGCFRSPTPLRTLTRLSYLAIPSINWCQLAGSNRRPPDYETGALPTELNWHRRSRGLSQRHSARDWTSFPQLHEPCPSVFRFPRRPFLTGAEGRSRTDCLTPTKGALYPMSYISNKLPSPSSAGRCRSKTWTGWRLPKCTAPPAFTDSAGANEAH